MLARLEPYPGDVLVACSGGADSMALAHLVLHARADGRAGRVALAYVDHGLRPDSGHDGVRVAELASSWGAEALILPVQVASGASLERAAREARFGALEAARAAGGFDWVFLAHTASDQAETVLFRILRGTGIVGLAGIPNRRGAFARPLLHVQRADTEAYCREHGIAFVDDPMNRDAAFARARMRHRILPALRAENPRLDEALLRLGEAAREQREVLDFAARSWLAVVADGPVVVAGARWAEIPAGVAKRALQLAAADRGIELESRHLEIAYGFACAAPRGSRALDLPGGTLCRDYDRMYFGPGEIAPRPELKVSGDGYVVRTWKPGDRMRPLRLRGRSRKLSDLFVDLKVPAKQRSHVRVVVRLRDQAIVWSEHVGPAVDCEVEVSLTPPDWVATNKR